MSGISSFQPGGTAYLQAWGTKGGVGEAPHIDVRDPASSDVAYAIGKNWVNEAGNTAWVLTSLTSFNGVVTANWQQTSGSSGSGITTLTGNTGGAVGPSAGNVTVVGSGGVTVTGNPGTNTLTITGSSSSISWTDVGTSFAATSGNGYFVTASVTATLPASPTQGDVININAQTASVVIVQAAAGQTIRLANSTSAVAGRAESTDIGCTLQLVYRSANTQWVSIGSEGSWTLI
jgi:hypothetical protein